MQFERSTKLKAGSCMIKGVYHKENNIYCVTCLEKVAPKALNNVYMITKGKGHLVTKFDCLFRPKISGKC